MTHILLIDFFNNFQQKFVLYVYDTREMHWGFWKWALLKTQNHYNMLILRNVTMTRLIVSF